MPIARFQMPDGRVARFEVPEGTTPEQAQSLMADAMGQQPGTEPAKFVGGKAQIPGLAPGQEAMVPANPNPPQTRMTVPGSALGNAADAVERGIQTAGAKGAGLGIGSKIVGAIETGLSLASSVVGGMFGMAASPIRAAVEGIPVDKAFEKYAQEYTYQPRSAEGQEQLGAWGETLAATKLPPVVTGPAGLVGMGSTRGVEAAGNAARAVKDVTRANITAPAAAAVKNAGLDAAAGMVDMNPRKLEVAGKAIDAGLDVPLHAIGDSTVAKGTGEALAQVPKSGSKAKSNRDVFTRRVIESIDPESPALSGQKVQLDPKTYGAALNKTGKQLGQNLRSVDVPMAGDLDGVLGAIADRLPGETEDTARVIGHRVGQIRASAEQNGGVLPGDLLHKYDSEIGAKLRQIGVSDPDQSALLHDIQSALRDAAESRMTPEMAEQTRTLRQRYARAISLMAVSDDIKGTGYIEPGKLAKVISKNKVADKLATTGRGNAWTDLAEAGDLIEPEGAQLRGRLIGGGAGLGAGGLYVGTSAMSAPVAAGMAGSVYGLANAYNRVGPRVVKALVKRERARNAPPEPPPERPLTTSPGAGGGEGGGPEPRGGTVLPPPSEGPLGPAGPDLTTSPGVGGVEIPRELSPVEQALAARAPVLDELTIGERAPSRIIKSNDARGTVERRALRAVPAVEGRPDLPPEMVAGDLADRPGQASEVAGNTAAGVTGRAVPTGPKGEQVRDLRQVEGNPEAMRSEGAVLGREKIRQDRFAAAGGTGQPGNFPEPAKPAPAAAPAAVDPRLAEIDKLRAKADSPAVQKVLDKREAEVRRAMKDEEAARKREADADALDAAAKQTQDAETKAALRAEAAKLREAIPAGEVKEGFPAEPKGKAEKIPVGRTKEVPLPAAEKAQGLEAPMPLPETTEIAPEVVEGGPRPPVGEATEIEPVPVGQADELLPVGQADEVVPVGDAAEMLPAPEAIEGPPPIEPAPAPKKRIIAPPGAPPAQAPRPPMPPAPKPPHTKMQAPQAMYRSVSPEEWEHIQKTGKITGGGNTFNGFENRGDVFFGAEPTEKLMAQGEEVMRRAEYQTQHGPTQKAFDKALAARQAVRDEMAAARQRHLDAGVSEKALDYQPDVRAIRKKEIAADAKVTAVQTQARTEISDRIKQLREADAKRGHTSVLLETKPVEGGRRYTGKHSGMGDEDEFGFDPGQITAGDIVKVKYVKDGKVIREEPGPGATLAPKPPGAPPAQAARPPMPPAPKPLVRRRTEAQNAGSKNQGASVMETDEARVARIKATPTAERSDADMNWYWGDYMQKQRAETEAAESAARAAEKAARSAETKGMSLAEIKANDHMKREVRFNGEVMPASRMIDKLIEAGESPRVEMVDKIAPMSRKAYFRADNAQQRAHEAKVKAAGKKPTYWVGDYEVSKTEYDYATRQKPQPASVQEQPQGRAGGQEAEETGPGDRVQRAAEGGREAAGQEVVVPEATKPDNAPAKRLIQPRDQGAKNVEAKIIKPARKNSEILADLNRQIDETARYGAGGPERITLKSGGTTQIISNTPEGVAKWREAATKSYGFKDTKTPAPAPEKRAGIENTKVITPRDRYIVGSKDSIDLKTRTWGGDINKRAPKTVVQDFINDGDFENAQALAEHYGIDIKAGMDLKQKKAYQDWMDSHPLE